MVITTSIIQHRIQTPILCRANKKATLTCLRNFFFFKIEKTADQNHFRPFNHEIKTCKQKSYEELQWSNKQALLYEQVCK